MQIIPVLCIYIQYVVCDCDTYTVLLLLLLFTDTSNSTFVSSEDFQPHKLNRRSIRKSAVVGDSRILECDIPYPDGLWRKHLTSWSKEGLEVPIYMEFGEFPPAIDPNYDGRLHIIEQASLQLSDIRLSDEGWYECKIKFFDPPEQHDANGTWIYLTVHGKFM